MKNLYFYLFFLSWIPSLIAQQPIDLVWVKSMGGSSNDEGRAFALDTNGNIYSTGTFYNTVDFDPGSATVTLTPIGFQDIFITKNDNNGVLIWAKQLGGLANDFVKDIDLDISGNIYLTGSLYDTIDFDPSPAVHKIGPTNEAIFICKLDYLGNFCWVKLIANGGGAHIGCSTVIDSIGNIYTTGIFNSSSDFDPGSGTLNLSPTGSSDVFISKLDINGNLVWAKRVGGNGYIFAYDFTLDNSANLYITGNFTDNIDFDPGPGNFTISSTNVWEDAFVLKLDTNGNFIWAKHFSGGIASSSGRGIETDASGNVYVMGPFDGCVDFDPGAGSTQLCGAFDIFLTKLNNNGNLIWAKRFGTNIIDEFGSLTLDLQNNLYLTGVHYDTIDVDPDTGQYLLPGGGCFLVKLDNGGSLLWANRFKNTYVYALASKLDNQNNLYLLGKFADSLAFGQNATASLSYSNGSLDIFIAKLTQRGVIGRVFNDINQNCTPEAYDFGIPYHLLTIQPGNLIVQTNQSGSWYIDSLPPGNYTITVDTSSLWIPSCPTTQTFTVVNVSGITNVPDFGLFPSYPCSSPNLSIFAQIQRPGMSNQPIYGQVCNRYSGTELLDSSFIIIELDTQLIIQSVNVPYTSLSNNMIRMEIDTLYPGECFEFILYCQVSPHTLLGQTLCTSIRLYPIEACMIESTPTPYPPGVSPCNTPYDGSHLEISANCHQDSILQFMIANTGIGNMTCYSAVRVFIDAQLTSLDSIQLIVGDTASFFFPVNGHTLRLETDQHPLHPGNSHPNATIELCRTHQNWTPGWYNVLPQDDADPVVDIFCGVIGASYDPNDKIGYPLGIDTAHYILPNQAIDYVIRFQNTGTDTAFRVVIRDTLSTDLDIFTVRSGVASHNYSFRMYGPRVLEWTFNNIMLPDSNHNEPESHGFISFKVQQNQDLPIGNMINNSAAIYFDYNTPVITNTYTHTINTYSIQYQSNNFISATIVQPLRIYPNPTSSQCTIEWDLDAEQGGRLLIYDVLGRLLYRQGVNAAQNKTTIDFQQPPGFYRVVLETDSGERLYGNLIIAK